MTVAEENVTRLPLVEKYRPKDLSELVSHTDIISTIKKMIRDNRVPHFLFYGPPGTGKTSTILAMAHELYGKLEYRSMVLELNASDDRGIETVRGKIIRFAENSAMGFGPSEDGKFKLIVLDEADSMTKDAQNALKRVIEKYSKNVRFCLICNHLSSIIPAIQSRCTRFRFPPLKEDQIKPRLDFVVKNEGLSVTEDGKKALFELSGGDMRKILNVLQSTYLAFGEVTEKNIYACVGQPNPEIIKKIIHSAMNDSGEEAIRTIKRLLKENALSMADVLENMADLVLATGFKENIAAHLIMELSKIQVNVTMGASENLQMNAMVAAFVCAREGTFKL
ncbi:unnamed protein product [Bursaphelenchus okinawaensis]|uniref:AAA+ ATPase domain-containing protein n=1 Tax=Bursaphelenchus okinawaensis TaxID=465554 RepID=A0A811KBS5_9BILA|nr:unnamed protein product [Bursaphelenchus okinawaensis]CAG9095676.1 unnamed protein product [Bursaphelenchus okinawaensis]